MTEARALHEPGPLVQRQRAAVARVAQLLEGVIGRVGAGDLGGREAAQRNGVGRDVVDEAEHAAGLQDARGLGNERGLIGKVVCREAAGHKIEAAGGERQRFGVGARGLHVCEAALRPAARGLAQHLIGDVACGDVRHQGRKGCRRVPGAGRDVERAPSGLRRGQLDKPLQAPARACTADVA